MQSPRKDKKLVAWYIVDYFPQTCNPLMNIEGTTVLAIRKAQNGDVLLLVPSLLQSVIAEQDWGYIREVFCDLAIRAKSDPESLVRQLSSLAVGPLQATAVDTDLSESPTTLNVIGQFVELNPAML